MVWQPISARHFVYSPNNELTHLINLFVCLLDNLFTCSFILAPLKDITNEHTDHVAIELVNGTLRISFNTDANTKTASVGQNLNDGVFHNVRLRLQDRPPFQATLSVDSTQSVTVSGTQGASFAGSLYLGGVPNNVPQIRYNLVSGKSYIGCIKVRQQRLIQKT